MIWILLFSYILPGVLTVAVFWHNEEEITRGDLIKIIIVSILPIVNLFIGYLGGFLTLCESKVIQDFFNTRIK